MGDRLRVQEAEVAGPHATLFAQTWPSMDVGTHIPPGRLEMKPTGCFSTRDRLAGRMNGWAGDQSVGAMAVARWHDDERRVIPNRDSLTCSVGDRWLAMAAGAFLASGASRARDPID